MGKNEDSQKPKKKAGICYSKWNKSKGVIEVIMVDAEAVLELKKTLNRFGFGKIKPF